MNTAEPKAARPRFVVTPEALERFERSRSAAPPPKPTRRRRGPAAVIDFFPDISG